MQTTPKASGAAAGDAADGIWAADLDTSKFAEQISQKGGLKCIAQQAKEGKPIMPEPTLVAIEDQKPEQKEQTDSTEKRTPKKKHTKPKSESSGKKKAAHQFETKKMGVISACFGKSKCEITRQVDGKRKFIVAVDSRQTRYFNELGRFLCELACEMPVEAEDMKELRNLKVQALQA